MNEFHANPILRPVSSCVSLLLIASLLLYAVPVRAQARNAAPPKGLRIMILSGEGALNNIEARTAREPIVQVQDENHKPVAGAAVLFTIHGGKNGAGGSFKNNSTSYSTITNAEGIAEGVGFTANHIVGAWYVTITATYGSLTASTQINENNFMPPPSQQTNTQFSAHPAANGAGFTGSPHVGGETGSPGGSHVGGGAGHGFFRPFRWFLTKPGMLVGGAVVVGAVIGTIIVTQPHTPTQILTGTSTVGAPAVRRAPGVTFHF